MTGVLLALGLLHTQAAPLQSQPNRIKEGVEDSGPTARAAARTAAPRKRAPSFHLAVGDRVRVGGSEFENGKLIAHRIELVEDNDVELEGVISKVDAAQREFRIGTMIVRVTQGTKIVDRDRRTLSYWGLSAGMRVKVKTSPRRDRKIPRLDALHVTWLPSARGHDLELHGPIEAFNAANGELRLLGAPVRLTDETRFVTPHKELYEAMSSSGRRRGIQREDDDPDQVPLRLGRMLVGGKVGISYRAEENYNLDRNREDVRERVTPGARIAVSVPVGEHSEFHSRFNFSRGTELTDLSRGTDRFQAEIKEAYFYWGRFLHSNLALQAGRQRFRDSREWIYDEYLDAIRLHAKMPKLPRLRMEFSAAKGIFGEGRGRNEQLYLMASAEYRFSGAPRRLRAYVIQRDDSTPRDDSPTWWGLSSNGNITRNSSYWVDWSLMTGHRRQRQLRGYGFDLGASYRFTLPWRPTLTVGYAFGSGDDNSRGPIERRFRQTGLQDNSQRIGGLKRYNTYGFVLDPELSNLKIPTFQIGVRPLENLSVEVIYHLYDQVRATDDIGDWALNVEPNGLDPRLGQAVDVLLAVRINGRWDFMVATGIFYPGPAFGNRASRAFFLQPAILFHF